MLIFLRYELDFTFNEGLPNSLYITPPLATYSIRRYFSLTTPAATTIGRRVGEYRLVRSNGPENENKEAKVVVLLEAGHVGFGLAVRE